MASDAFPFIAELPVDLANPCEFVFERRDLRETSVDVVEVLSRQEACRAAAAVATAPITPKSLVTRAMA